MNSTAFDYSVEESKAQRIAQEYAEYAYIVSHDLNATLRHVREFSRLLMDARPAENLSQEEKQYLAFLEQSLSRMDEMQQALLSFSRVNTRADAFDNVSTQNIADGVLASFAKEIDKRNAIVECAGLPDVYADAVQINNVFSQLISNALKFHTDATAPEIKIYVENQAGDQVFVVSDNGIGIAKDYHEDVFRLFRRLHDRDHYPGVGAGLTIARKIIQRHGGRIWLESQPGMGTRVCFTLGR